MRNHRLTIATSVLILALSSSLLAIAQENSNVDGSKLLEQVKSELNNKSDTLTDLSSEIGVLEQNLEDATERVNTLEEQLGLIDSEIESSDEQLEKVQIAIERLEREIKSTKVLVERKAEELREQEQLVAEFMQFLFVQNINVGSFDSSVSQTLKLLFAEETAHEQLNDLYFLELVEVTSRQMFIDLEAKKIALEEQEKVLKKQKIDQEVLRRELTRTRNILAIQRKAKDDLLDQTKGQIEIYGSLIAQAQRDQLEIRQQIKQLASSYDEIAEQIKKSGNGFAGNPIGTSLGDGKLGWPLKPTRGVSAFFRDSAYRAALGVEHNAVDIRAVMQTPVVAAEDGVVYRVKGGEGLDYHYIIIAHRSNILTLYGHMYDIYVQEGQAVRKGQQIGLSGGLPGSRGAGLLTTGPHLHFEVIDNGRHQDPMLYLDLTQIDQKYIPDKYLGRIR